MADIGGFISAPIKLAAIISDLRLTGQVTESVDDARSSSRVKRKCQLINKNSNSNNNNKNTNNDNERFKRRKTNKAYFKSHLCSAKLAAFGLLPLLFLLIILLISTSTCQTKLIMANNNNNNQVGADLIRHHTHYMNIVPSTHFHYKEGRQLSLKDDNYQPALNKQDLGGSGDQVEERSDTIKQHHNHQQEPTHLNSHIYKRSSALISSSTGAHYPPLVGTMQLVNRLNPLSRRMMSEAAHTRWTSPRMVQPPNEQLLNAQLEEQQLAADSLTLHHHFQNANHLQNQTDLMQAEPSTSNHVLFVNSNQNSNQRPTSLVAAQETRNKHEEAELLLRQKQHIQYHDQWPSMAGKCHKRTLNFCASVLPFNTTTFPNIIGDTNRFEVKRSLPFFGFLAKSSCNKRLDELLCLLLEPPCGVQSGLAIPPCKKFCRLALEGCNEYIPATLAMSSVFDCRQYPDSNDPNVCINLAQGSKCAADEFKCPDKTCIPRNWLCDGVRDCIFAADEANCTALTGVGLQTSVCSTEEFKCDGKCVPKAWKCDGERDCLDGTDEEACDQRPRCGPDRFKCADGNGCLPKRWVCDGKAECRDGSDELNCELQECSENDFKCDNGICIPKLWRCDGQADCKDGSDERNCVARLVESLGNAEQASAYLNNSNVASTLPTKAPSTTWPTPTVVADLVVETTSQQQYSSSSINQQLPADVQPTYLHHYATGLDQRKTTPAQATRQQQLELDLSDDSSPTIQQESTHSSASSLSPMVFVTSDQATASETQQATSTVPHASEMNQHQQQQHQQQGHQQQVAKELKKFDYDIIQSPSPTPNVNQINGLLVNGESPNQAYQQISAQLHTQVDFVPQQQQQQAPISRQVLPVSMFNQEAQRTAAIRQHPTHDGRGRTFGQVIKASKWTNGELQTNHHHHHHHHHQQQQQQHQQQPVTVERVPIYRSLFKNLKNGGRAFATQGEYGRYAGVTVRRRRDRHHLRSQPGLSTSTTSGGSTSTSSTSTSTTTTSTSTLGYSSPSPAMFGAGQTEPDLARFSHWTSVSPAPEATISGPSSAAIVSAQQQPTQQVNYTMHVATPVAQSRSHGVASYLQLLQSRYNLRLPRV